MAGSWSVHQLVEFVAAVSGDHDEERVLRRAVELTSETLGAEIGAVVVDGAVRATVGFGTGAVPDGPLLAVPLGASELDLESVGDVTFAAVELLSGDDRLLVGRVGGSFDAADRNLLAGMGRILGLSLRTLRLLSGERELRVANELVAEERLGRVAALQEREQLLETFLVLQRAISHRAPLDEVLDAVTAGASGLLGGRAVWLFLRDQTQPLRPIAASTAATGPAHPKQEAALASALDVMARGTRGSELAAAALRFGGFIGALVHVEGSAIGALVVESGEGADVERHDRNLLITFAEHASMALTDAETVAAVKEAFRDPLTGLANRRLLLSRAAELVTSQGRAGGVAALFVDLDRFKAVNDTFGHAAGDDLLRAVAKRLSSCLRPGDDAARFGGDEFAVLLERVESVGEAVTVARRIIERLRRPFSVQGKRVVIGASVGIAFATDSPIDIEGVCDRNVGDLGCSL